MATVTYTPGACEALLLGQEVFNGNNPADLISPVGLVQALRDETNTRGTKIVPLLSESGHTKQVRVFWRPPVSVTEVEDAASCAAGAAQPYLESLVTMGMHSRLAIKVTEADIRKLCESFSEFVRLGSPAGAPQLQVMAEIYEQIRSGFDAMRQDMNQKLNNAMVTKLGNWLSPDGGVTPVTSKTYIVRNSDGVYAGSPVLDGLAKMRQDLRKTTLNGDPIIVGNGVFELTNEALKYGCCNAGGTDFGEMARQAGYRYYVDDYTGTVLSNPNGLIIFKPGMAHLLVANKNVGNFNRQIGTKLRGLISDPAVNGLAYDVSIMPDECGEFYNITLDVDYDLFVAPNTIFKATDPRTGINGTFAAIANEQTTVAPIVP